MQGLVISVHMPILQLNDIESVTSHSLWLIKIQVVLSCVVIRTRTVARKFSIRGL